MHPILSYVAVDSAWVPHVSLFFLPLSFPFHGRRACAGGGDGEVGHGEVGAAGGGGAERSRRSAGRERRRASAAEDGRRGGGDGCDGQRSRVRREEGGDEAGQASRRDILFAAAGGPPRRHDGQRQQDGRRHKCKVAPTATGCVATDSGGEELGAAGEDGRPAHPRCRRPRPRRTVKVKG